MYKRKNDNAYRFGRLPAEAPLANPYVPFQEENAPVYQTSKGLIRGTMYPGLDLPFMGVVNQREKNVTPMTELQALNFAIQELALYLDTHRGDREALVQYRNYQKLYGKCLEQYQMKRGSLNHTRGSDAECYDWLDDPWPWEYCANKEV